MTVKDLVRPIPGVCQLSRLHQQHGFSSSVSFWKTHYAGGGTSGGRSHGSLARGKADFLNTFVAEHNIVSVTEFGCSDGHQLTQARYPRYVGHDVSTTAIELCKRTFPDGGSKSFFLYHGICFFDSAGLFDCDLALSLDVVFHLIEDGIFTVCTRHLFGASRRHVVIYSTDAASGRTAVHVRHRTFTCGSASKLPQWRLTSVKRGPMSDSGGPDFFVYERVGEGVDHPA